MRGSGKVKGKLKQKRYDDDERMSKRVGRRANGKRLIRWRLFRRLSFITGTTIHSLREKSVNHLTKNRIKINRYGRVNQGRKEPDAVGVQERLS